MDDNLHPHIVHLAAPTYHTERMRTFDPEQGDAKKPDAEEVIPAQKEVHFDDAGEPFIVVVPERRIPYWGFDEQVPDQPPPADCPDCGVGLASLGHDFICMRLHVLNVQALQRGEPPVVTLEDEHDHPCIIACGLTAE